MAEQQGPPWHIGTVAERTSLSLRTLRHYDEVGLLTPSSRTEGGFRLYTEDDVERLLLIRRMKPLGFSLEEMSELLAVVEREPDDESSARRRRTRIDLYVTQAEERRADLARRLAMADEFVALLHAL